MEEQLGYSVALGPRGIPIQHVGHEAPLVGGSTKVGGKHAVCGVDVTMRAYARGGALPITKHLGKSNGHIAHTGIGVERGIEGAIVVVVAHLPPSGGEQRTDRMTVRE